MTGIRWVALLPDPVTGFEPVLDGGKPREWLAPDKGAARNLVSRTLTATEFRICDVVSVLEWEARKSDDQQRKQNKWAPPRAFHNRRRDA